MRIPTQNDHLILHFCLIEKKLVTGMRGEISSEEAFPLKQDAGQTQPETQIEIQLLGFWTTQEAQGPGRWLVCAFCGKCVWKGRGLASSERREREMIRQKCFSVTGVILFFFMWAGVALSQPLEKVIVSYPAKTITSFFVSEVARQKEFFREEGIDIQLTYVRAGAVEIAAILSGDIDYALGGVSAINAIVADAPLRLVMSNINRVDHLLLAQPKYKTLKDLKGQLIGAQNPGGMINIIVKEIFDKNGLDSRDVTMINMGGTQERYVSLKSGAAAATLLGMPHSFVAEKEGFRRLAAAGDYVPGFSGLVVRGDRVSKKPDQVRRMIRASLKAMRYIREHRQEMAQMIAHTFTMAPDIAQMTYGQLLQIMSPDGMFNLPGLQFFIDLARERQNIRQKMSASQIVELAPLEEVRRGMGLLR